MYSSIRQSYNSTWGFLIPSNSTSNTRVDFGGIFPLPEPLSPYPEFHFTTNDFKRWKHELPRWEGIVNLRRSPTHIFNRPWSQPWITSPLPECCIILSFSKSIFCFLPRVNSNGSPRSSDESNFTPVETWIMIEF